NPTTTGTGPWTTSGCSARSGADAALIALGNGVGLLSATFSRRDLHPRKERLEAIARGEVGEAAKAAAAAQSATIAAAAILVILPTIIH
ncbi:MAG: hypothetical protein VXZ39_00300, partial [Planctomycetota bacterium]|nr:hypothetical protein [Planctomycetota bacterium]